MHALNGNVQPTAPTASWQRAGRGLLNARELGEPQLVSKLRSAGWTLPTAVQDDQVLRVYDVRLDPTWLRGAVTDLAVPAGPIYMVGGDFSMQPYRDDALALQTGKLSRWGPIEETPVHLVVPPRYHLGVWLQRARQQLGVECLGTWITVGCVVPREACPTVWDQAALKRALPQAACILDDPLLEVRAVAIGERPPVMRVPADTLQFPPPQWETALLPRNRVLLFLSFRRASGDRPTVSGRWLRGAPPPPPQEDLEILRLELILPPATKSASGERALRGALRQVAGELGTVAPSAYQLRQVQVAHGVVYALLGVPRGDARQWLRGSGCKGLFIRPFWTASTGNDVSRGQFSLLWLRGHLGCSQQLWDALRDSRRFFLASWGMVEM